MERQTIGLLRAAYRYMTKEVEPALERATRGVPDGRGANGRTRALDGMITSLVIGKMIDCRTLRQVELATALRAGEELSEMDSDEADEKHDGQGSDETDAEASEKQERQPDTTVHDVTKVTPDAAINHVESNLVRQWHRDKKLPPAETGMIRGRPVDVVEYDGQEFLKFPEEKAAPYYRKSHTVTVKENGKEVREKRNYWTCGVVHAVLASSPAKVCMGHETILGNDENSAVLELDNRLANEHKWFAPGRVLKMADAKHGTTGFFDQQGDPYDKKQPGHYALTALKGTHKAIYKETRRVLDRLMVKSRPAAETDWEDAGHRREIKREVFLAPTNNSVKVSEDDAHKLDEDWAILNEEQWPTIQMVFVVKQTTRYKSAKARGEARKRLKRRKKEGAADSGRHVRDGDNDIHYRYFAMNVKQGDVVPKDLLLFVRKMWEVEVYHNKLVCLMRREKGDWSTQGNAPVITAGVSAIALNFLNLFRCRRLRENGWRHYITFPQLLQVFMMVTMGAAFSRLVQEKDKSRKSKEQTELEDVDDERLEALLSKKFEDKELQLLAIALKIVLGKIIDRSRSWLTETKERLLSLVNRLKGVKLQTH